MKRRNQMQRDAMCTRDLINDHAPVAKRLAAVLNVGDLVPHALRECTRLGVRVGLVQWYLRVQCDRR